MARIAALLDEMFEDVEYARPADAFRSAGHEVVVVGLREGKRLTGKQEQESVLVQQAVGDVTVDEFDALFIPGGYSPDHLRADPKAVDFTRRFVESGRPVLSICHAPQLLVSARVLKGRRVTGWKSVVEDIKNAGGLFENRAVVEDGNLVSSRDPGDIPEFIDASLRKIEEFSRQPAGGVR